MTISTRHEFQEFLRRRIILGKANESYNVQWKA